jgi:RNA polymerase sigma-70 factor (ECF subfamily)
MRFYLFLFANLLIFAIEMNENLDFDKYFRLYYDALYRFCRIYISDAEECHDIVTAAFEVAWKNYSTLRPDTVKSFLFTIVRTRAIDFLRRQGKHQNYIRYMKVMADEYVAEDHLAEDDARRELVDSILRQIGPPASDVLKACYIDGKKYKEVAAEMNMNIASVKKYMVKALKMLREIKKNLKS